MQKNKPYLNLTEKISNQISSKMELIDFAPNTTEQAFLFFEGVSFGILAENAILQRTEELLPLEVLAVGACTNFHLSCDFFLKFILSKFGIFFNTTETLQNLFLKLPTIVREHLFLNFNFESKILNSLPTTRELDFYANVKNLLQIFHFLNNFQRKLQTVAMDIEQNNFFA